MTIHFPTNYRDLMALPTEEGWRLMRDFPTEIKKIFKDEEILEDMNSPLAYNYDPPESDMTDLLSEVIRFAHDLGIELESRTGVVLIHKT